MCLYLSMLISQQFELKLATLYIFFSQKCICTCQCWFVRGYIPTIWAETCTSILFSQKCTCTCQCWFVCGYIPTISAEASPSIYMIFSWNYQCKNVRLVLALDLCTTFSCTCFKKHTSTFLCTVCDRSNLHFYCKFLCVEYATNLNRQVHNHTY